MQSTPRRNLREIKQQQQQQRKQSSSSSIMTKNGKQSQQQNLSDLITIEEYHNKAQKLLPKMHYDYYRSGADSMVTLESNQQEFRNLKLRPRMLIDVSNVDTSVVVCDKHTDYKTKIDFPVMIAPTAMHKLANNEGEKATARAAATANTIFCLSSLSTTSVEDVASCVQSPKWFQLYILKDRKFTERLVKKAEKAGYRALLVTVDAPKLGNRIADHHNKFHLPEGMQLVNLLNELQEIKQSSEKVSALNVYFKDQIDASLTWKDIAWLRSITKLPIMVKGVITAEDAILAVENNVDGIIVSNHGARQVDTTISTIEALPEVAQAVKSLGAQDRVEVYLDGGVTKGTDVLKALALGAKAVFIGRTALWGLAVGGEQGVVNVLNILKAEFTLAMQLCGCPNIQSITPALIKNPPGPTSDFLISKL
jgi:isopentenyl diphosphate isomerase/L-lactate dehydrogenase-like FMN-dependent dehydrogenase